MEIIKSIIDAENCRIQILEKSLEISKVSKKYGFEFFWSPVKKLDNYITIVSSVDRSPIGIEILYNDYKFRTFAIDIILFEMDNEKLHLYFKNQQVETAERNEEHRRAYEKMMYGTN